MSREPRTTEERWDPTIARLSPAFLPYTDVLGPFEGAGDWPALTAYDAAVADATRRSAPELGPIRFVRQEPKPARRRSRGPVSLAALYDARITCDGEVPTRERNHHDFWNAIAWAAWPRTKRAIHARQYDALRRWIPEGASRIPGARTREQDALTIFDEGGVALLVARPAADALERWLAAGDAGAIASLLASGALLPIVFGHAVLEHAQHGRAAVHALGLVAVVDGPPRSCRAEADRVLSTRIAERSALTEPIGDAIVDVEADGRIGRVRR